MDIGDTVALGAVLVALGSLLVTLRVSHNRLVYEGTESEKRMQQEKDLHAEQLAHEASESEKRIAFESAESDKRLDHERREAALSIAADGYVKAVAVLTKLNGDAIYSLHRGGDEKLAEARDAVSEARETLAVVAAVGWDGDVRQAAADLHNAVAHLWSRAHPAVAAISMEVREEQAVEEVSAKAAELRAAAALYRRTITGDNLEDQE